MMMWPVTSLLAHLWHPKRANERQLPTNTVGRRARLDDGSGAFLPVAVACNERPVRVEPRCSRVTARRSGVVKGFRTPASHWREGVHGGRRPKSLEGGNRGGSLRRRRCRAMGI